MSRRRRKYQAGKPQFLTQRVEESRGDRSTFDDDAGQSLLSCRYGRGGGVGRGLGGGLDLGVGVGRGVTVGVVLAVVLE